MKQNIKLIIPLLSGCTTLFGLIPIYFKKIDKKIIISNSLALSAGIMISISLFSLIPESINYLNNKLNFITITILILFINLGIIISQIINKRIGIKIENNQLYKVGISSLIVLILHNIPEGIITYITTNNNLNLGLSLSLAIAIHNIPEGISIAIPIYYSTKSKRKAFILTLISGFSELFGAVLASIFINKVLNPFILFIILSITSGIMIHLSLTELIPEAIKYKNKQIFIYFIIGIILILIVTNIFKI